MAQTTIEWTATVTPDGTVLPGYTFNPWIGCSKVSRGCKHCYAETLNKRWGHDNWGLAGTRRKTSEANWKKPLTWNREAEKSGIRRKVFCASMADVFEDRPELAEWRAELFELIEKTPHLDWLLLTKRPENVMRMVPGEWSNHEFIDMKKRIRFGFPPNVWIGTSIEDQDAANTRIPELLKIPASVRFLSMEPLVGNVDLKGWFLNSDVKWFCSSCKRRYPYSRYAKEICPDCGAIGYLTESHDGNYNYPSGIHWVIVGGESGHKAEPMHPEWVRSIRDQCAAAGVPFFFKQWGERIPSGGSMSEPGLWEDKKHYAFPDPKPGFPLNCILVKKVGKKKAGNILDGVQHKNWPK